MTLAMYNGIHVQSILNNVHELKKNVLIINILRYFTANS